jgi:hypothetical protein
MKRIKKKNKEINFKGLQYGTTRKNSVIFYFPKFVISNFGEIWAQKVAKSV